MNMHKPETPLEQNTSDAPKKTHRKGVRVVVALLALVAIAYGSWLVGLVPGPHVDYGPAPTIEEARSYLLEDPDYGQVEFLGYVKSEDNVHAYKGGRLPAGWMGYRFHKSRAINPKYGTEVFLYPCLYQRPSLEWYGTTVLTAIWQNPGWHYQGAEGLSKYHNRCGQPGGIADFHNEPEGSAD